MVLAVKKRKPVLDFIPFEVLLWGSCATLLLHILIRTNMTSLFAATCWWFIAGSYLLLQDVPDKYRFLLNIQDWIAKHGLTPLIGLQIFILFWIDIFAAPANAQFYLSAEDYLTGALPDATELINLIFIVLRGIVILYVGYNLVKVVTADRDDQDWKSLARTPLIVVMMLTIGDGVITLIVG